MQLERAGLTVWVNAQGKHEKGFGVRVPLGPGVAGWQQGLPGQGGQGTPRGRGNWRGSRTGAGGQQAAAEGQQPAAGGQPGATEGPQAATGGQQGATYGQRATTAGPQGATGGQPAAQATPPPETQALRPLEVIGPAEGKWVRLRPAADQPFAAARGADPAATTIELRLPLRATEGRPLAVGALPGGTIAIGLSSERGSGPRGPARSGGESPSPATQAEQATSGAEPPAVPAAGTAGGSGAGQPAPKGTPVPAPAASPAGQAGAASGPAMYARQARRPTNSNWRGGRGEPANALNVWMTVTLARPETLLQKALAGSAQGSTAKTQKVAAPAKASVAPAATAAPAPKPAATPKPQ